jgi:hypothetical protein
MTFVWIKLLTVLMFRVLGCSISYSQSFDKLEIEKEHMDETFFP